MHTDTYTHMGACIHTKRHVVFLGEQWSVGTDRKQANGHQNKNKSDSDYKAQVSACGAEEGLLGTELSWGRQNGIIPLQDKGAAASTVVGSFMSISSVT